MRKWYPYTGKNPNKRLWNKGKSPWRNLTLNWKMTNKGFSRGPYPDQRTFEKVPYLTRFLKVGGVPYLEFPLYFTLLDYEYCLKLIVLFQQNWNYERFETNVPRSICQKWKKLSTEATLPLLSYAWNTMSDRQATKSQHHYRFQRRSFSGSYQWALEAKFSDNKVQNLVLQLVKD